MKRVRSAVLRKLEEMRMQGITMPLNWVAHAVCADYADALPDGEAGEFYSEAGYMAARDTVRRVVNGTPDQEKISAAERQAILPGFEHVHFFYSIVREGKEVPVSVYDMTDAEIDTKVKELRAHGRSCFRHADELERLKAQRLAAQ